MPAGNETNNFVRDGSMLPHHDIDTTTTPNSWKPKYPIRFGDINSGGTIYADGTADFHGREYMANLQSAPNRVVTLPLPITDTNYPVISQGQHTSLNTTEARINRLDLNSVLNRTGTSFEVQKPTDWLYQGFTTDFAWSINGVTLA